MSSLDLNTKFIGKEVLVFDEIDSTNSEIKRQGENGAHEGLVVIANSQTAGRGRMGRNWESPSGRGIFMSILLRPDIKTENASMITLVAAMAARKMIYEMIGIETLIKWPNDLVVNGKKVCGILTEMSTIGLSINYVTLGVGINVNMESFPKDICQTATSLYLECGRKTELKMLIENFLEKFEEYYSIFLKTEDLSSLKEEYNGYLANKDKFVKVIGNEVDITGTACGVNEIGELLVLDNEGKLQIIRSGEVSVRGIYGYV